MSALPWVIAASAAAFGVADWIAAIVAGCAWLALHLITEGA